MSRLCSTHEPPCALGDGELAEEEGVHGLPERELPPADKAASHAAMEQEAADAAETDADVLAKEDLEEQEAELTSEQRCVPSVCPPALSHSRRLAL